LSRAVLKLLLKLKISMHKRKRGGAVHRDSHTVLVLRASRQALRVVDVPADGDCQFHALALAAGFPGGGPQLRAEVADWLRREGRTCRADPDDPATTLDQYPETDEEVSIAGFTPITPQLTAQSD
jgi:hypothetical protein